MTFDLLDIPTVADSANWAEALVSSFVQIGYVRAEPAILQPAEPFLDLSGEDIRKSLYLTTDATGEEFCLRPDLTIPVARDYLASARAGEVAKFSYLGPVFRHRGKEACEFQQVGVESFGEQDRAMLDARMLAIAEEAVRASGVRDIEIRTGDVGLFNALLDALNLYPVWRRRLIKDFKRGMNLEQDLARLARGAATVRNDYEGVLAALAGSDRKAALALVTDLMSIAGATNVGGRTTAEIADRFLEQSTLKGASLPREARDVLKRFLSISCNPLDAIEALRKLAADTRLDITAAIDEFERRIGLIETRGLDVTALSFSTSFGRGLDYYTGFEFELHHKGDSCSENGVASHAYGAEPLAAGGRYDALMTQLGSREPIPAVGFSIWIDALTRLGRKAGDVQ